MTVLPKPEKIKIMKKKFLKIFIINDINFKTEFWLIIILISKKYQRLD